MLDDIRLLTKIKDGDLDGVLSITSAWTPNDYKRLLDTHVYPLHLAACFGHFDLVQHFCGLPELNINQQDQNGSTPLHLAAAQGHLEIVQLLLEHPEINDTIVDNQNKDPLVSAYSEEVRAAICGRFDVGTALHEAALANDDTVVAWLIKHGANIVLRDNDGQIPYDLATDFKVKELLSEVHIGSGKTCTRLEGTLKNGQTLLVDLRIGCFSYFKSKDDIDKASRGTILMKSAQINWKGGSTWFEVVSLGSVRYELKASHIVETKKWVAALLEAKEAYSTEQLVPERQQPLQTTGSWGKPKVTHLLRNSLRKPVNRKRASLTSIQSLRFDEAGGSCLTHYAPNDSATAFNAANDDRSLKATLMSIGTHSDVQLSIIQSFQEREEEFDDTQLKVPTVTFTTLQESIMAQKSMITDAMRLHAEREEHWVRLNSQQQEQQALWRNNLEALAKEHYELQSVLRRKSINPPRIIVEDQDPEMAISDEEEDFFDADDGLDTQFADSYLKLSQTIPSTSRLQPKTLDTKSDAESDAYHDISSAFIGYPTDGQFRAQLEMSGEKAPDLSIWSILKNSVGKDLSRIAVPVEFNEPTSMLQRMCEDMEYSGLLDMAAKQSESLERMLWVAAFAMSNYSSTHGRTGKPFNPLLGETFEYVRPDRGYRYVSEQVSHHPPISACYAESPNYIFQAEVKLVSKFWGKSFELNPKGVTHLFLRLPKLETAEVDSISSSGSTEEHYSWTKVTSAMNNIIIGTMYIEHYGDMVIKNHTTGVSCTLTFHRTGWRSSNRHVVRGKVRDADGREVWELGGRWDDKLVARRVGMHDGEDLLEKGEACFDQGFGEGARPILLWKMTPPPSPKIVYNLTKFAVSLNDLPEGLAPHLPPTDSRHRPDQRAMEHGDFSTANSLKVELESKQRQRRNGGKQHVPRWFSRGTDPDTDTTMWVFNHQYWVERSRCGSAALNGEDVEWENVP
ncbi:hypothetical protein L0F63_001893, partial [Massospora cicadina]